MDPASISALAQAGAQVVTGTVSAGFDYGKAQLQAGVDKQKAIFGQTTDINQQGWNFATSLGTNSGFNQALANKYANRKTTLFGEGSPNWVPWAAMAAVVVVLILIIRR
jgi:hypothetical protein